MNTRIGDIDTSWRPIDKDHANFMEKSCTLIFGYFFVFLFYITLFAMAMTSFYKNLSGAYFIYVYIILLSLMIMSFFQLAIIIKKRDEIKERLQKQNGIESRPVLERIENKQIQCWWNLIQAAFYLTYYILKWSYFIIKLFDFRECFWKYQNYTVSSILRWVFQLGITIYCIVINASMISWQLDTNVQIACLVFILARFFAITVYFWQFELYVPSNIINVQKKFDTEQISNQVFTISEESTQREATIDDNPKEIHDFNTCCLQYLYFNKCFNITQQYKPVPEFGRFMRLSEVGTEGCILNNQCLSADLEHILKCHDDLNIPTRNCCCFTNLNYYCTGRKNYMIGFHQTTNDAAISMSMSPFRCGKEGMFGGGIYFARSINQTIGKAIDPETGSAREEMGSVIVALIDMGKMKLIDGATYTNRDQYSGTTLESLKAEGYDSVYGNVHGRPELIIYEPERVKKFIVCYHEDFKVCF